MTEVSKGPFSLKVLCFLAMLPVACLSKMVYMRQNVSLLEGDVVFFRHMNLISVYHGEGITLALKGAEGNLLKIVITLASTNIAMEDGYGDYVVKMPTDYPDWKPCWYEHYVRVFHDRYEVYGNHIPVGVAKYRKEKMGKGNYADVTCAYAYFDDEEHTVSVIKNGPSLPTELFWLPQSRVQKRTPAKALIGQTLFLEVLIGDGTSFFWNKEPTHEKPMLQLYDRNTRALLEVEFVSGNEGEVIKPNKAGCGHHALDKSTILRVYVDVKSDKYVIRTEVTRKHNPSFTSCEVMHSDDPNDVVGFAFKGGVDPLRYTVFERNE